MSWTRWIGPSRKKTAPASAVAVGCSAKGGRFQQRLRLVLRPELLPLEVQWCVAGNRVDVLLGSDEAAGMLRLQRNHLGSEQFGTTGGKKQLVALSLHGWEPLPTAERPAEVVEWVAGDGCLDIHLPGWARPGAAGGGGEGGSGSGIVDLPPVRVAPAAAPSPPRRAMTGFPKPKLRQFQEAPCDDADTIVAGAHPWDAEEALALSRTMMSGALAARYGLPLDTLKRRLTYLRTRRPGRPADAQPGARQ